MIWAGSLKTDDKCQVREVTVLSVTDQNGKQTTYASDDADRLISVTDAAQHVLQMRSTRADP